MSRTGISRLLHGSAGQLGKFHLILLCTLLSSIIAAPALPHEAEGLSDLHVSLGAETLSSPGHDASEALKTPKSPGSDDSISGVRVLHRGKDTQQFDLAGTEGITKKIHDLDIPAKPEQALARQDTSASTASSKSSGSPPPLLTGQAQAKAQGELNQIRARNRLASGTEVTSLMDRVLMDRVLGASKQQNKVDTGSQPRQFRNDQHFKPRQTWRERPRPGWNPSHTHQPHRPHNPRPNNFDSRPTAPLLPVPGFDGGPQFVPMGGYSNGMTMDPMMHYQPAYPPHYVEGLTQPNVWPHLNQPTFSQPGFNPALSHDSWHGHVNDGYYGPHSPPRESYWEPEYDVSGQNAWYNHRWTSDTSPTTNQKQKMMINKVTDGHQSYNHLYTPQYDWLDPETQNLFPKAQVEEGPHLDSHHISRIEELVQ